MACGTKTKKKIPTKRKGGMLMMLAVLLLFAIPAFSAVPLTYFRGLKSDSLSVSGGASFEKHININWAWVETLYIDGVAYVSLGGLADTTAINAILDSLAAYPDTTVTNSIWDSLASYPDTTITDALADRFDSYYDTSTVDSIFGGYYDTNAVKISADTIEATAASVGFYGSGMNLGSGNKFSTYSAGSIIVHYNADTSEAYLFNGVDTMFINPLSTGTVDNVKIGGHVKASYIDADTVVDGSLVWGVGKATAEKTVDTVLISGCTATSVVLFVPAGSYTVPLYVSSVLVDTFMVTAAEADTAVFRASGYHYQVKKQ